MRSNGKKQAEITQPLHGKVPPEGKVGNDIWGAKPVKGQRTKIRGKGKQKGEAAVFRQAIFFQWSSGRRPSVLVTLSVYFPVLAVQTAAHVMNGGVS